MQADEWQHPFVHEEDPDAGGDHVGRVALGMHAQSRVQVGKVRECEYEYSNDECPGGEIL